MAKKIFVLDRFGCCWFCPIAWLQVHQAVKKLCEKHFVRFRRYEEWFQRWKMCIVLLTIIYIYISLLIIQYHHYFLFFQIILHLLILFALPDTDPLAWLHFNDE